MEDVAPFLILLALALLFWFAMIRPQQRRQRALGQMQRELSVGDEVMLTSGIIGVLRSLDEKTVQLEVSDGVNLRVVRAAVGQVTTPAARDDDTQLDTELAGDPADEPEEK
ncbi:MAG TPA: preprotein translocase subunit YajC [Nocardioides sp.]|uniref:preprotein translocase subunit YajC n=1 Tax=Nocardioides sp. TaxID=35761 RepID=UPI002F3FEF37